MCTYKWGKFFLIGNTYVEKLWFLRKQQKIEGIHICQFLKGKIKVKKMFVKGMMCKWREENLRQNSKYLTNLSFSEKVWYSKEKLHRKWVLSTSPAYLPHRPFLLLAFKFQLKRNFLMKIWHNGKGTNGVFELIMNWWYPPWFLY